ncbi:unnamed protein product [Spirodela intermedia]|uniref:Uncharacterized protein n=1 Tax=Spirodela intermedia TaxID=51605 RepID=A0A7I8KS29_SPIIN|nr:unnamed protein product [Spirodela intermedia]
MAFYIRIQLRRPSTSIRCLIRKSTRPLTTAHLTLISPSFPVSTSMAPIRTMAAAYFFAQPLGFSANDATLSAVRELVHSVWSEVKSPLPLCRFL